MQTMTWDAGPGPTRFRPQPGVREAAQTDPRIVRISTQMVAQPLR